MKVQIQMKIEGIEKGYQSQKSVQTNDTLMGLNKILNKTSIRSEKTLRKSDLQNKMNIQPSNSSLNLK